MRRFAGAGSPASKAAAPEPVTTRCQRRAQRGLRARELLLMPASVAQLATLLSVTGRGVGFDGGRASHSTPGGV